AEPGDLQGRGRQLAVPGDAAVLVADAPDFARGPVAVEVRPAQLRELVPVVDEAAGERAHVRGRVLDGRFGDRRRAGLAGGVERVAALDDAPAVVGAALHQVRLLPQVLPVVADPQVVGLAVDVQPPRVAEAVRPRLGTYAGRVHERVVRRD